MAMRTSARTKGSRSRSARRIVALLFRAFVVLLMVDGAGLGNTFSVFAGDHDETTECCTDCPLESSGGECPAQCPVCQCSHGSAALPQSSYEVALDRLSTSSSMQSIPYDVRIAKAPLLAGLYRPPRVCPSFA